MQIEIRKANRKDLSAVVRLLAEMDGERPLALADASRIYREMSRYPSCSCYLARLGGQPVGTFTLLVFATLVHNGAHEALVDGVVVSSMSRGRGVGTAMMVEAMRLAAQAGCYKLMLSSNSKRRDAHRFYRRLGFRQHGLSFWVNVAIRARSGKSAGAAPKNRSQRFASSLPHS
jgi:GNAT superfamily N-acetyltransferase